MDDLTPNSPFHNSPRRRRPPSDIAERARIFDAPTIRSFDGPFGSMPVLEAAVDQANLDARRLEHILIVGPAGAGKQVLARAIVRELAQQAVEVDGESVESLSHLMELVRLLKARDVLVVRHVDLMPERGQQHLAVIVGERRAPRLTRAALERREWLGLTTPEPAPAPLPEFSLLATAADMAKVQPMLRQHIELTLRLATPNAQCQHAAIRRALAALQLQADAAAADRLVEL
ncbi:MAG: AAA family ATPase, partial [Phycisphaerae bacterium]|nr:AAA family ATPase [Phycisphaerae bacterium]